jgi:class 3 adenylate cyclase/tetratricopeptide (TPR) repeat protein
MPSFFVNIDILIDMYIILKNTDMTRCPFCNHQPTIKDAIYCANCGSRLVSDARQAVTSDRLKFWGGELRLLSVFFVNFVGFEKYLDRSVHSHVMITIRECFKEIEGIIKTADGSSNQIVPDDRILAIFGAPRAHHDDPIRAVRCAYNIRQWWLEKKSMEQYLENIDITIGVHTGRAFFGYVLEESSFLTVIGDTINTACRLAELCPAREIMVSENTYEKVQDYVEVEHIGERSIKGRKAKVDVYLVKEVKEERRLKTSQKYPLFGREKELNRLIELSRDINRNRLTIAIIRGQMGIGKSRLKEGFEEFLLRERSINFMETHCSTDIESPYFPFRFLLREYFKLNEFDSKELMARKIDEIIAIKGLSPVEAKGVKHLFLTDVRRLKGEEARSTNEEIYISVKNLLRRECQNQPLILIFEEFNKIDVMSRELISYLSFELENEPLILLMVNITKDFLTNISSLVKIDEINLSPLSIKAVGDLVKFMLDEVDDRLVDFIYRTTGGNPLFAIEAVRHSQRANVIKKVDGRWSLEKEQRLPFLDDLYGVVMSTIDSLPTDYRLIIDYASVIGYSFGLRILRGLLNRPELRDQLDYLIREGYIILSKDEEDPIYIFRHNLLKDAAYTVLPLRKRKELHQKVAGLFETTYAGQLSNFYENIAHHYMSSDNFRKAAVYFKMAGDRAMNIYALEQALHFYKTFLKIKKDHEGTVPADLHREVLLNLADLYEITGNVQKMEDVAIEGLEGAVRDKNLRQELNFTERQGYAEILFSRFEKAEEVLLLGVQKCEAEMEDVLTMFYADLGLLYTSRYEYEKGILYYNMSWNTARDKIRHSEILCLYNLAQLHRSLGNFEQALEYLDYGLEHLIGKEDMHRIAQFKYLIGDINHQIWYLERAMELLAEASRIAEAIGHIEVYIKSNLDLSIINIHEKKHGAAVGHLDLADKKLSFFTRENLLSEINLKKALISFYRDESGKAEDYLSSALRIAQRYKQREVECQCHLLWAMIDKENGWQHAQTALEIAENIKLPPLIAAALFQMTRQLRHEGDLDKMRFYGKKALLIYNDLKTKLSDDNRQFFSQHPEFVKLLEL